MNKIPCGDKSHAEVTARLESTVGYTFSNRDLLTLAMTHSSRSNETGERNHHLLCNERLEFLGDSILSFVVSDYLFSTYPTEAEGDLTCMRKDVVCAAALARYARRIGLGDCLLLGIGEERNGGRDNENILADAFEALLTAIYLDAGERGIGVIRAFLLPMVREDLENREARGIEGDYKTPLQQLIQQTEGDVLEYVLVRTDGPDHMKTFEVEARLYSDSAVPTVIGRGTGRSKRKAEQAAAKDALALFGVK